MALRATRVNVGTTAIALVTGPDSDGNVAYRDVAVQNNGAAIVYLGPAGVTAATGFPLAPSTGLSFSSLNDPNLFGIVASGTTEVAVLESGV